MLKRGNIPVQVKEVRIESPVVKSYQLVATDGGKLPKFSAGSHITTMIHDNEGQLERSYSLINSPEQTDSYKIAIRRSEHSKGGSIYWHTKIKEGDRLEISYPKNHFPLSNEAKHHVFFAAGIGITPFLSMAKELKHRGLSFELHYAAPLKENCAFYSFLTSHYSNESHFYFSNQGQRMTPDIMKKQKVGSHVYFCGPSEMIKQFTDCAIAYGYPEQNIHYELFSPPELGPSHEFLVKLKNSNLELTVPKEKSILDVLLEHNINVPYSCKIGGCGTCQVAVLKGSVSHRDFVLSKDEKRQNHVILTCVSRAKGDRLVLGL